MLALGRLDEVHRGFVVDLLGDPFRSGLRRCVGLVDDRPQLRGHEHLPTVGGRLVVDVPGDGPVGLDLGLDLEDPLGVPAGEVDADLRLPRLHEQRARLARGLRVYVGAVALVVLALEDDRHVGGPKRLDEREELVGAPVGLVVLGRFEVAERRVFLGRVAGHHVEAPAATGDVVDRHAELGEVEGVEPVVAVSRGELQHPARDGCCRCRRRQRFQAGLVPIRVAPLPDPAGERHLVVEADSFGLGDELGGQRPLPVVLVAVGIRQDSLGAGGTPLDVPGEQSELEGLPEMRIGLPVRFVGPGELFNPHRPSAIASRYHDVPLNSAVRQVVLFDRSGPGRSPRRVAPPRCRPAVLRCRCGGPPGPRSEAAS